LSGIIHNSFNGVVLLNIDASGKINTVFALNINFNRLIIAEKSGDKLKVNNQLELEIWNFK